MRALSLILLLGCSGSTPSETPTEGAAPPAAEPAAEAGSATETPAAAAPAEATVDGSAAATTGAADGAGTATGATTAGSGVTATTAGAATEAGTADVGAAEAAPATSSPTLYDLLPPKSIITVQVTREPDTVGAGISHDHVIQAESFSGHVSWNAADPAHCAIELRVPVKSLVADAPDLRKRLGYDVMLTDNQRELVTKHMLDKDQLDATTYPEIVFKGVSCATNGASVDVTGTFTLHGTSKPITVPMKLTADGSLFTARGSFTINGSSYGVKPYTAMLGALKNADKLTFNVQVEGRASGG